MGSRLGWRNFLVRIVAMGLPTAAAVLLPARAMAGGLCEQIPQTPPSYASRIAMVACTENALWFSPFIDSNGRLASFTIAETERIPLRDGTTPAWQRVADYWKGSGLLGQVSDSPGANDCASAGDAYPQTAPCRAFLADTPWSAVFVSFVMNQAGVPGFKPSASHIDFIRNAYSRADASPYVLADPEGTAPAMGDLLCFARMRDTLGPQGLRNFLGKTRDEGLNMHCDIVVAAKPDGGNRLYLVGGNVLQGVTMRVLSLNRKGLIWGLPAREGPAVECQPDNEDACSFNRQDWVALLKLKPLAPPIEPMRPIPSSPPACCTACSLPMPEGVQRCPAVPVQVPDSGVAP
jgi:hypothetical protein